MLRTYSGDAMKLGNPVVIITETLLIGALAEIIGAGAVVVSLLYLGRQVALANRLAKAEAWRSRHAELTTLNASLGVDPRFHRAMIVLSGHTP